MSILSEIGISQEVVANASSTLSGEMKLLETGFYEAKVKRAGTYVNKFNSKSFFVEIKVGDDEKFISGSITTKDGKPAQHIIGMIGEIAKAAGVDLADNDETSKGKIKDYGAEYSATIFDAFTNTSVGLIAVLSYNEEDDFQFRENLTVCQSNGENAKGEDLKAKLDEKMEGMDVIEGHKVTKRRAKKKSSNSKSKGNEEAKGYSSKI